MALLDTASLIVTPNGYKASKLYSIVPSDGTGDMAFSRTGNTATRVNSSGLIETVNANIPRLDYLDGTCPKLLLEPQRTNLITYSDQFDQVTWGKTNTTVLSNQIASPDGSSNADKLTNNNINSDEYVEKFSMPLTAGTYTASIFVKNSDAITSAIRAVHLTEGTSTSQMTYTWATNTFTITGSNGISGKVTSYGNGWVRLQFTYSIGTVTDHRFRFYGQGFAQNSKYVYIYGAQVEVGTYATSYIPTTTASVTRNADSGSKTAISSLIGSTEGTIFCQLQGLANLSDFSRISISDGTTNNKISIGYSSTNNFQVVLSLAGSIIVNFNTSGVTVTNNIKIAFKYKLNSFTLFVNGVSVATLSSGAIFSASTLTNFYFTDGNGSSFPYYGKISSLALWKTSLSDSECVTLTT